MPTLDIVSPLPPFPPHAGGTAHIFQASRQLSRYFTVSLYALAGDPASVEWGPMGEWCSELRAFPKPGGFLNSTGGVRHLFDPPAVRHDWSNTLAAFLRNRWLATSPNVVQLEFTTMAQYAPLARSLGIATVCTAHNVAFLAQMRRAQQERHTPGQIRRWFGAFSLWQYERRALRQCDLVIVHGLLDGNVLRRWLPGVPIVYVPSGIDLAQWPPCESAMNQNRVLFVGNYAHPPNVEGVQWFVREVWPLVRRNRPEARLTLAGRAPPQAIRDLAADDIFVLGTLTDLRPIYARSSMVIAPIFWGSGVRVKLLEALACALPVVATPLAAEGIKLQHEHNAFIAASASAFADAVLKLLASPTLRQTIGLRGRQVVEHTYNWPQIARRLAGLYNGITNN